MEALSSLCKDCGVDTTPCTGKRGCRHKGKWEYYMVHKKLWLKSGMAGTDAGFLCIGCLESRIGRQLTPSDFNDAPVNEPFAWDTPRLLARKGYVNLDAKRGIPELWSAVERRAS